MDKRIGKAKQICRYPKCNNKYYRPIFKEGFRNKHFFQFPKNDAALHQWKDVCNINRSIVTDNYFVCEDHFVSSDFMNYSKTKLKPGVVPGMSKHCNINDPIDEGENGNTDSTSSISESTKDKYSFLYENMEIVESNSEPAIDSEMENVRMLQVYQVIMSRILKLSSVLQKEKFVFQKLTRLYKDGKFNCIIQQLKYVSHEFLQSNLNVSLVTDTKWTEKDHFLALSFFFKNEKLYKCLSAFFPLPPLKKLKHILTVIPLKTDVNDQIRDQIKPDVMKMNVGNRTCILMMAEMKLSSGIYYDETLQHLCGYEDLGDLRRTAKQADRVLVLMARGLRKNWTQVVAYYFSSGPFKDLTLQNIIAKAVKYLQSINFNVVAFVCEPNNSTFSVLSLLCVKTEQNTNSFYFIINYKRICVVFSVPHLIRETRNALTMSNIIYDEETGKVATFEHIKCAYSLDQTKRIIKQLSMLKEEYFDLNNSDIRANNAVGIATLNRTVAVSIETFVRCGELPLEAMHTAEFVEMMHMLYDSLNGSTNLSTTSHHLQFWASILAQLPKWRLINVNSQQDVTSQYCFNKGWEMTLESLLHVWDSIQQNGFFTYLSLKQFSLEPLENLLADIAKYGTDNKSPTCYQFVGALKCEILNGNEDPYSTDNSYNLNSLQAFTNIAFSDSSENIPEIYFDDLDFEAILNLRFHEESAYLSGYLLQKINIPDCQICKSYLLAEWVANNSEIITNGNSSMYLLYASDPVIRMVDKIMYLLSNFLRDKSSMSNLEDNFKALYKHELERFKFCNTHLCNEQLINLCIKLSIYRFIYYFNNEIVVDK